MVPLGWAAQQHAWGPKRVLQLGNIGTAISFLALPAQSYVANFLETFKEFPPRMKAASFSLDQVMEALEQPASDH